MASTFGNPPAPPPRHRPARHRPARRLLGWLILLAGALVLLHDLWHAWQAFAPAGSPVALALWGGSVAALATALGTVPILGAQPIPERVSDTLLGFGAGVMLAAAAFSLVVPALNAAASLGFDRWQSSAIVGGGILIGAALLLLLEHALPHEHFIKGLEGRDPHRLRRIWLFVAAIVLHNVPEGLAIGVAFAGTDRAGASALAFGIAIQDIPEGLVVALALRSVGYQRALAAGIAILSGVVEPIAAVIGASIITASAALLPWGLAIAAGAMLFVISHEIIPESHRKGHERSATTGLMIGFVVMMALDTALG